jgi:hypothetical protein
MKLERITLRSIRADKSTEFLKLLEALPDETIQTGKPIYASPLKGNQEGCCLSVEYGESVEKDQIKFNIPSEASKKVILPGGNIVTFNYQGNNYELSLFIDFDKFR